MQAANAEFRQGLSGVEGGSAAFPDAEYAEFREAAKQLQQFAKKARALTAASGYRYSRYVRDREFKTWKALARTVETLLNDQGQTLARFNAATHALMKTAGADAVVPLIEKRRKVKAAANKARVKRLKREKQEEVARLRQQLKALEEGSPDDN